MMHAGVVHEANTKPRWESFPEPPGPGPGQALIQVITSSIGPSELTRVSNQGAQYYGAFKGPKVVGGEGIGRRTDGSRVYFGHSLGVYGSVAERTLVSEAEVWPIPTSLSDEEVLPLAISGTGALIPLEEARIRGGERVLILGATGPLGQIALQLARILGAGEVVAAARREASLRKVVERGFADYAVRLGEGNDAEALKSAAKGGFDVVLDCIYGDAMVAALKATARGGRVMSIGNSAGRLACVDLGDLVFRTHAGVATGIRPVAERRAAFERLTAFALAGKLQRVDTVVFQFEQVTEAWDAQANSPNAKVLLRR
jgi:NADPH:quinone reductase-like Zn-dependent oxidoreductase